MKVFLGGTCGTFNWREEVIQQLELDYFNPVVQDWTPECQAEEIKQKQECDILLYVITPEMKGVYSIAEAVDDSNKNPHKVIFAYTPSFGIEFFTKDQHLSLDATCDLIKGNGSIVLPSKDIETIACAVKKKASDLLLKNGKNKYKEKKEQEFDDPKKKERWESRSYYY